VQNIDNRLIEWEAVCDTERAGDRLVTDTCGKVLQEHVRDKVCRVLSHDTRKLIMLSGARQLRDVLHLIIEL
jgi:hypothetical protein